MKKYSAFRKNIATLSVILALTNCSPDFSDRFNTEPVPLKVGKHKFEVPRNYLKSKNSFSILLMLPKLEPRNHENDKLINDATNQARIYMDNYANPKYKSSHSIEFNNKENQLERLSAYLHENRGITVEKAGPVNNILIFSAPEAKKNTAAANNDIYVYGSKNKPDFILLCSSARSRTRVPYCRYDGIMYGDLTLTYTFPMTNLNQAVDIHASILNLLSKFYKETDDDVSTLPKRPDSVQ